MSRLPLGITHRPFEALTGNAIAISMNGKGAGRENVLVKRLRRSVKYEECICRPTSCFNRPLSGLLQRETTAFEPWRHRTIESAGSWITVPAESD